ALHRPHDPRLVQYARRLQPRRQFAPDTEFTIDASAKEGVPLKQLVSEGRSTMTLWLWLALGFAFCTHFFMSQWLTTLLTPEIGFSNAARTQALFQAGAGLSFIFGLLVDRRGIPVLAIALAAAAVPVAAVGFTGNWGAAGTMLFAFAAGILVQTRTASCP